MDLVPAKPNTHLWERSQRNEDLKKINRRKILWGRLLS